MTGPVEREPARGAPADREPVATAPSVSPAQRAVLSIIRRRGEATVDDVAASLDMTAGGARQHLASLAAAGLVEPGPTSRPAAGPGRPPQAWRTTDAADPLFPKAYGELTNELLGYLDDHTVTEVFVRRRDTRIAEARERLAACATFDDRVAELTSILDRDGYLADWTRVDEDTWMITEHNCAIQAVATRQPLACRSELEFLRAALDGADIERTSHIVAGQQCCAYRVVRSPFTKSDAA